MNDNRGFGGTGPSGPHGSQFSHILANILSNANFSEHALHINAGFSCSVCHTAHGMGPTSPVSACIVLMCEFCPVAKLNEFGHTNGLRVSCCQ